MIGVHPFIQKALFIAERYKTNATGRTIRKNFESMKRFLKATVPVQPSPF
jgi:hypothetical protein